jgi:hypothetical protein
MQLWASRAGWKKKKALPQKAKLYIVNSLGDVLIENGDLKIEGAQILQMIEMGVQRSDDEWKELLDHTEAKAMAVLVDMDKAIPGVDEEEEVEAGSDEDD